MSTRSAITTPVDGAFQGVYHHFDGYPEGVGEALLKLHQQTFKGDLDLMVKTLITDHPAGWSNLLADHSDGDPKPWSLEEFGRAGFKEYDPSRKRPGGPACYCHGSRSEEANPITCKGPQCDSQGCDALWIEWLYVLTPEHIGIWGSHSVGSRSDSDDGYRHRHIADIPWDFRPEVMEHVQKIHYSDIPLTDPTRVKIDAMDRTELARAWRFSKPGNEFFQPPYGDYLRSRFLMLGGMSPEISKEIGLG